MSIINSHWNQENDAAINSPGDQGQEEISKKPFIVPFEISQIKNVLPEYDVNGTVLNVFE